MDVLKCSAFVAAVELGSILAASKKLNYTSSGVNKMITALEEELNVILLNRPRTGVEPTETGRRLIPIFKEMIKCVDEIQDICIMQGGDVYDTITVGSFHEVTEYKLPDVISRFSLLYPKVRVNVNEGSQDFLLSRLRKREMDLAIIYDNPENGVLFEPLYKEEILLMSPNDGGADPREAVPLQILQERPFISFGRFPAGLARATKESDVKLNISYTTASMHTLNRMVSSGVGSSCINSTAYRFLAGNVVCQHFDPPVYVNMSVAYRDESMRPIVKKFVNMITQMLGASGRQGAN